MEADRAGGRPPYRLVRLPIYTGLILAAFALAIKVGQLANLAGTLLRAGLAPAHRARAKDRPGFSGSF